jgi:serine/threonine kinase 16
VLFALCYFKSPYDFVYEKGDSVNLAVISGTVHFPEETPFDEDVHDLILFMLKVNPAERPFIDNVLERSRHLQNKIEAVV